MQTNNRQDYMFLLGIFLVQLEDIYKVNQAAYKDDYLIEDEKFNVLTILHKCRSLHQSLDQLLYIMNTDKEKDTREKEDTNIKEV